MDLVLQSKFRIQPNLIDLNPSYFLCSITIDINSITLAYSAFLPLKALKMSSTGSLSSLNGIANGEEVGFYGTSGQLLLPHTGSNPSL